MSTSENFPPRSKNAIALCIAATLACLAADLLSKDWAYENLSVSQTSHAPPVCTGMMQRIRTDSTVLVDNYLEFQYAENCGAAFGMLREAPDWVRKSIFGVAASLASVVLLFMFARGRGGPYFAASVPLIVSGALGNLIDRIRYGYVVDFIRFRIPDVFEYPTFNVADITITIGVVLLILDALTTPQPEAADDKSVPTGESADEANSTS